MTYVCVYMRSSMTYATVAALRGPGSPDVCLSTDGVVCALSGPRYGVSVCWGRYVRYGTAVQVDINVSDRL
jgi:hypothetical protein